MTFKEWWSAWVLARYGNADLPPLNEAQEAWDAATERAAKIAEPYGIVGSEVTRLIREGR